MRQTSGILWIAAGAALWGTDTVLRRPLTASLSPIHIVFFEHLILSPVVLPLLLRERKHLAKLSLKSWAAVGFVSWIGSFIATVLFTYAIRSGSPTTAVLLQKAQPLFAIALAKGVLGERWRRLFPAVVFVALIGTYLISFGNQSLDAPWSSLAVGPSMLALGAAAGWGASTVFGRYLSAETPFELITTLRIVCALPLLFAAAAFEGLQLPPSGQVLPLVLLALLPGFAGLMLYYRGLRSTAASHATIAELAFPACAALLNWMVLGFAATPLQILGFMLIWSVIFLMRAFPSSHPLPKGEPVSS